MFPLAHVLISAVTGTVVTVVVLAVYRRWSERNALSLADILLVSGVVGLSILVWREAGNTAALNEDAIPGVSPNDVLCPIVTYVSLSVLAAFRRLAQLPHWSRIRALLTLVSLVVNVATI